MNTCMYRNIAVRTFQTNCGVGNIFQFRLVMCCMRSSEVMRSLAVQGDLTKDLGCMVIESDQAEADKY